MPTGWSVALAGTAEASLPDRPHPLRPLSWAGGTAEPVLLVACLAVLAVVSMPQLSGQAATLLTPLSVVPVLAAAWLGSTRVTAAVGVAALAGEVVLAAHGDIRPGTAATRAAVFVGLLVLCRVAAVSYAALRVAAARLALVSRVSRIATSSSSLDDILGQVLEEMARDGLRGGVIALIDEDNELYVAAAQGEAIDDIVRATRIRVGEGIMGRVAATGRSLLVPDLDAPDAPPAVNRNLGTNARMRSLLAVPVLAAGRVIGVLSVDSGRVGQFDADDQAVLEQIAVAIAGSVQRTGALQLADRLLQKRLAELRLLLDTGRLLTASLDLEVVLHEVARSTAAAVSHRGPQAPGRATVYRIVDGWARAVAVEDSEDLAPLPADFPVVEHPFMSDAIATGRVATGRFDQTGVPVAEAARRLGLVAGAWAPIRTGTALFGVLAAVSRDQRAFDDDELHLLEGIAALAGLAIGNAESLRLERERVLAAEEHAERMAAVERVKSEFLRLASHELRGPLAVLGGYLSMIEDGSVDQDEFLRILPVLSTKVADMNRLVDQMLETARLEDGGLRLDRDRADLATLVRESVHTVLPLGSDHHDVVVDCDEPIPVYVDADRIVTVVANMVHNAVKYSPQGGEIRCTARVEEGRAVVTVTDQGIGIAATDLPRLFTRFGRVVTRENSHIAGTGLGLYLARELARMHGGDIGVESQPGVGSRFTLWLPLARSEHAHRDEEHAAAS